VPTPIAEILDDLVAEFDQIDAVLTLLSHDDWAAPSGAPGWSVRDVMVHLAQTEEGVVQTLQQPDASWTERNGALDRDMATMVDNDPSSAEQTFARWRAACRASVTALRNADPDVRVRWAAAPLRPATLATTRLAEHWAHALDIVTPLGIYYPDTDRLRHIAWLGHSTIPYAYVVNKLTTAPPVVRCELTLPSGASLTLGPANATSTITGSAAEFCRVGAQRLNADESNLVTSDEDARSALRVLRNYAA
jgi:uncharacterized protein (TIGR03084 family)